MTKYQEAMKTECRDCGGDAQAHRLTPTGNFYCLELNAVGWDRYAKPYSARSGIVDLSRIVYTCAVRYLRRSPLPSGLGHAINGALKEPVSLIGDTV